MYKLQSRIVIVLSSIYKERVFTIQYIKKSRTYYSLSCASLSQLLLTINTNLNHRNYPMRRNHGLSYFHGQSIFGYIHGIVKPPPKEVDSPHHISDALFQIPNLNMKQWPGFLLHSHHKCSPH